MNRRNFLALLGAALAAPVAAAKALGKKPRHWRDEQHIDWSLQKPAPLTFEVARTCPVPGCNGDMRHIRGIPDVTGHQGPHTFKFSTGNMDWRIYGYNAESTDFL